MKISSLSVSLAAALLLFVAVAHPASGTEMRVRSESLRIEEASGEVRFMGDVHVGVGQATLDCSDLVLYQGDTEPAQVERAIARGKVVIRRSGDRLEAGVAELDVRGGTLVLSESPVLVRGNNEIRAQRIEYSLDSGIATFHGPVEAYIKSEEGGL